jgi:hypothetical protein
MMAAHSLSCDRDGAEKNIFCVCEQVSIRGTLMKGLLTQRWARGRKSPDSYVVQLVPDKSHQTHWVVHPAVLELIFVVKDMRRDRVNFFAQVRRFTCPSRDALKFKKRIQNRFPDCPQVSQRFCLASTIYGFSPYHGGSIAVVPLQLLVGKLVLVPKCFSAHPHGEGDQKIAHAIMPWGLPPPGGSGGMSVQAVTI